MFKTFAVKIIEDRYAFKESYVSFLDKDVYSVHCVFGLNSYMKVTHPYMNGGTSFVGYREFCNRLRVKDITQLSNKQAGTYSLDCDTTYIAELNGRYSVSSGQWFDNTVFEVYKPCKLLANHKVECVSLEALCRGNGDKSVPKVGIDNILNLESSLLQSITPIILTKETFMNNR